MHITLKPTARVETLAGISYRVYEGETNTGIKLEMLGLFRVSDALDREQFERQVCAVDPLAPRPVTLLSQHGLVRP